MNLYEYQGQKILSKFGIKYPFSIIVSSPEEAIIAAKKILEYTENNFWVIKAQIKAGGRGLVGGIKLAKFIKEIFYKSYNLLGMYLITNQTTPFGKLVKYIIISNDIYIKKIIKEYYISFVINRSYDKNIIMYSNEGGELIEEVDTNKIFIDTIHPLLGLQYFQIIKIAFNLKLDRFFINEFIYFISNIYKLYITYDAYILEINPFITNNHIIAVDIKLILDNNALYRHNIQCKFGLNSIQLDGNIGCIVNGAGLAMANMDIVKYSGVCPANFLDIRGTADANIMKNACNIIIKTNICTILINIFGGIVRCDNIAIGIIYAYTIINEFIPPIILRLEGTNSEKSQLIIEQSCLNIYYFITLQEYANIIKEFIK
jgi:succinyl-CoA synthetase beta subunit